MKVKMSQKTKMRFVKGVITNVVIICLVGVYFVFFDSGIDYDNSIPLTQEEWERLEKIEGTERQWEKIWQTAKPYSKLQRLALSKIQECRERKENKKHAKAEERARELLGQEDQ